MSFFAGERGGAEKDDFHEAEAFACIGRKVTVLGAQLCLTLTLWTVAHQAPLSTGFSRQEYWSGLPCPPPGDLPDPGIEQSFYPSSTWEGRWSVFHGGRRAWRPLLQEKTGEIAGKALIPAPTAPNFTTHCLVGKLLLTHTGWPPLSPHT